MNKPNPDACYCNTCKGAVRKWGRHPNDPTGEKFGDHHWPLPFPHEKGETPMNYMLIDVTTVEETKILLVAPLRQVQLLGKIRQAAGRVVIAPPLEGRGFAKLDKLQMQYLYWDLCKEVPPEDYTELIRRCLDRLEAWPVDQTSLAALEKEVAKLYPEESVTASTKMKEPKVPGSPDDRPKPTSTTGRVWEIADRVYGAGTGAPDRKAIIDACSAEGINVATASTQFAKWRKAKGI